MQMYLFGSLKYASFSGVLLNLNFPQ